MFAARMSPRLGGMMGLNVIMELTNDDASGVVNLELILPLHLDAFGKKTPM